MTRSVLDAEQMVLVLRDADRIASRWIQQVTGLSEVRVQVWRRRLRDFRASCGPSSRAMERELRMLRRLVGEQAWKIESLEAQIATRDCEP